MKVILNSYLLQACKDSGIDTARLAGAVNAAYHDGTVVMSEETTEKIAGTQAVEKKGLFRSREATGTVREGRLTDPLRMLNFSIGLDVFQRKYGCPHASLTIDIVPTNLRTWLEIKFGSAKPAAKVKGNANGRAMTPAPVTPEVTAPTAQ
jgi:hypothetical protein